MSYFPDYSHDLSAPNEAQFVVTNMDVKKFHVASHRSAFSWAPYFKTKSGVTIIYGRPLIDIRVTLRMSI